MNILSLVSQNLYNFYQIQTKCYSNSDTVLFSPIHRTKRGPSRHPTVDLLPRGWRERACAVTSCCAYWLLHAHRLIEEFLDSSLYQVDDDFS
jgi:hypothetical protein